MDPVDVKRSPLLGSLTVATGAALFGMLGLLSRTVYDLGMTPFGFVTWRAGIGALVVAALVAWRVARRGDRLVGWRSIDRRSRASIGLASLMGATLNLAMFLAFARVPIAVALLCFYLYPAVVAGASAVLGWEPLDRVRVMALVISLGGMVAVVAGGSAVPGGAGLDPFGVALALSAALSQAVFVLVSRGGYRTVPTDQAMFAILAMSSVVAGMVAMLAGVGGSLVLPFSSPTLLWILAFAGIFAAAIPSLLFLAGIRWIGPLRAGILMLVEPLVGVGLAAIFLDESIGPVQIAGGLAILAAAVLIQRAQPAELMIQPAGEPEPAAPFGAAMTEP